MPKTPGEPAAGAGQCEYLLIARHGRSRDRNDVREVAGALKKTLEELDGGREIQLFSVAYGVSDPQCRLAAAIYSSALNLRLRPCHIALDPDHFSAYRREKAAENIRKTEIGIERRLQKEPQRALLVIGHEPAIDWLLDDWVDDKPIHLAHAELVCLGRERRQQAEKGHDGQRAEESQAAENCEEPQTEHERGDGCWERRGWRLLWMLTPTAESAIEPLRAKLASKMTVLGVLAGFTLAVTAGVLDQLPTKVVPRALAGGAVTCFACAAAIYVCVLLAYDDLMMPPRFWRGSLASKWHARGVNRKVVRRPPSSAGIVIYQHMISLWHWVVWALGVSWVGIVLLALSEVWVNGIPTFLVVAFMGVGLGVVIVIWRLIHKPDNGTED